MTGYLGEFLAFLSALAFALSNIFISRTRGSRGDKGVLFSVVVTIAFSFALFLLLEAGQTGSEGGPGDMLGLAWFALSGLAAMVFGRTFVFESVRRLGVARSSAVKRLNPVFSVLLAWFILSESLSSQDLAGIAVILAALGLLAVSAVRSAGPVGPGSGIAAYSFGIVAALAYAVSYIARKLGLETYAAPALGTFLSALSGFAVFAVLAVVWPRYRPLFTGMFRNLDRWIVLSAILVSIGQILMFAALAQAPVSVVVMISSLEVFLAILLASFVFRIEPPPGAVVTLAAFMATAGAILLAAG